MAKPIPLPTLTLYAELAQQVAAASRDEATVVGKTVKGIRYLRLQRWVGQSRVFEHLGRADDAKVLERAAAAAAQKPLREERRRLVSVLRRLLPAPSAKLGKVLDALASSGLFERGAVLVGTAAYQLYAPLVGAELPAASLMTQDADLATLDLAISADDDDDTAETILRRADPTFAAVLGLDPRRPPAKFRSHDGFMVDFLTPVRRRSDPNPMPLKNLKAGAVPMQQLDWLIADAVSATALHGAGIRLLVPQPARYAVHKLIVAQKRDAGETAKRQKDLHQAKALIDVLNETAPYALEDAMTDARRRGDAGWRQPIARSLAEIGRAS